MNSSRNHHHESNRNHNSQSWRNTSKYSPPRKSSSRRDHHYDKSRQRSRSNEKSHERSQRDHRNRQRSRSNEKSYKQRDGSSKNHHLSRNRSRSNDRSKQDYDHKNTQINQKPNNGAQDIFDLLEAFREEVCTFLKSVYSQDIKPEEIFMRWYLHSLIKGGKDYFMPIEFNALENDLAYHEKSLSSTTTKQEICNKVNTIFQKYCTQEYCIKKKIMLRMISNRQENRLKQVYSGPEGDFLSKKYLLLSAYKFMGTLNNHLSVPPDIFKNVQITELFGSPLNTSHSYCSPFSLEKELFSSNGSFFEYSIQPGLHVANPPFDETIMEDMADRLEGQLDQTPGINIICIIPVWDPESQEKYGLKVYGKPFAAYTKLKNSKYFKEGFYLDKYKYPFWDYYNDKFTPASATHFIILSNTDSLLFKPEKILEDWRSLAPAKYSSWKK